MHLSSKRTVLRFKLAAWLTPLRFLLIPASIGMGLYTLLVMEGSPARIALGVISLSGLLFVIFGWLSQFGVIQLTFWVSCGSSPNS